MKVEKDYLQDIAEIRSMMERSSKFLSLAGGAGILAGVYALAGAYIAVAFLEFDPVAVYQASPAGGTVDLLQLYLLGILVLFMAVSTAVFLSFRKGGKKAGSLWNPTSKRLVVSMAVPLVSGGLLLLLLTFKGLPGLLVPTSLIFYGLALYNAGTYTYKEVRTLGMVQIGLGLVSAYFISYGMILWALGFGVFHIIYGIFMHYKYER